MKNLYTINIYLENNIPLAINIAKKELLRLVKYFNLENTKKVIYWDTLKSTRYKYIQNGNIKFLLCIDENT